MSVSESFHLLLCLCTAVLVLIWNVFFKKICLGIWLSFDIKRNPTAFLGTTAILVNQIVEIRSQVHTAWFEQHSLKDVFNFTLVECLIPLCPVAFAL